MAEVSIPARAFNRRYRPYIDEDARYLVFYGGASSGKSYFIVQRYLYKLMKEDCCNLMVVRNVGDTNRDSTFALFRQIIRRWKLGSFFKTRESDMRVRCINGNSVIFKGLDDSEKLKSVTFEKGELTDIWIEEATETDEEDFNQLDIRLRGKGTKKQIVISFNPVDANHWLKKRFFDRENKNCVSLKTTYKDNDHLGPEEKELLESYRESDPYYYAVYCLGEWGTMGNSIFDKNKIYDRLGSLGQPEKVGLFAYNIYFDPETKSSKIDDSSILWCDDPLGPIKIYKDKVRNVPYVMSGDTAGEGSDYFANHVLDNITGEQVAVLRQKFDEDAYADQCYCLGKYYNEALIGIETNFSGYPARRLQQLRYPRQYVREKPDVYTGKLTQSYGWLTSQKTRPVMVAESVKFVREHCDLLHDKDTLQEMLQFVRNSKGRPEAASGAHDDLVMSFGIALCIRGQQNQEPVIMDADIERKAYYTSSMMQDFEKAGRYERERMIEKWGYPVGY